MKKQRKSDVPPPPSGLSLNLQFLVVLLNDVWDNRVIPGNWRQSMTKQEVVSPPGLGAAVILTTARLLEGQTEAEKKTSTSTSTSKKK